MGMGEGLRQGPHPVPHPVRRCVPGHGHGFGVYAPKLCESRGRRPRRGDCPRKPRKAASPGPRRKRPGPHAGALAAHRRRSSRSGAPSPRHRAPAALRRNCRKRWRIVRPPRSAPPGRVDGAFQTISGSFSVLGTHILKDTRRAGKDTGPAGKSPGNPLGPSFRGPISSAAVPLPRAACLPAPGVPG